MGLEALGGLKVGAALLLFVTSLGFLVYGSFYCGYVDGHGWLKIDPGVGKPKMWYEPGLAMVVIGAVLVWCWLAFWRCNRAP
jgi:hypothetical protein